MENFCGRFILGLFALSLGHVSGAVDTSTIFFRHYNRDGSHDDVNINEVALLSPKLNTNEWTVFYIHGYRSSVDTESVTVVVDAYLRKTNRNVIAIDYRQIVGNGNYTGDALAVDTIGKAMANAVDQLVQNGLNPDKIHVIGHSLGGQVVSHVGIHTTFRIPRITALDPAGPMFYERRHLKPGDAQFVDVMHTDAGVLGFPYSTGDADFYPNAGREPQPGCPVVPVQKSIDVEHDTVTTECSHNRSWKYYAESILNPDGFMSIECSNSLLFDLGKCNRSNIVPMGFAVPFSARGTFYLRTNGESPFAKGMQGI